MHSATMQRFAYVLLVIAALAAALFFTLQAKFGGGARLADRTTDPKLASSALEVVANLDFPPGNIAVSKNGRIFFTLHPDGEPPTQVNELIHGKPVAYPNEEFQHPSPTLPSFQSVLSVRIDQQGRLWVLDHANYGRGQPRILAFDLSTNQLVHQFDFPKDIAGFLSMLNDFQIDPQGRKIYIAEASPIRRTPALIVYDTVEHKARRLLDGHPSVQTGDFLIQAPGRDMIAFGFYTLQIGIDSIALDKHGEWLYYGAVTNDRMYRVATRDLNDESLDAAELGTKVQVFAPKTLSDGLTMDVADNIYISDMEHSAILSLGKDRKLVTLLKDDRLRWPDGFSFGPDGWLYVSCSSLQHVLFISKEHMHANAPYQIFRFKPGVEGIPGQ
ncbi:MAG TPA: L-dopachrome tautomerase-related protein [Candidatus Acidoferrales bacterium]|nr:L-dopachrome tautomerase-related protein [Candidatus Acidoferrales bacterium]